MEVSWDDEALSRYNEKGFAVRLRIVLKDTPGALGAISNIVAQNKGNITALNTVNSTGGFIEINMDIDVMSAASLEDIITAFNASALVSFVQRVKS